MKKTPLPALPGTNGKPCGLFVDRWGTLLHGPEKSFPSRFDVELIQPGAVEALFRAHRAGWHVYLVGNEDAVAQGRVSDTAWQTFEEGLLAYLTGQGVLVQRSYACLDDPEKGKGKHGSDSVFRFPNTGALYHAAHTDGIDLGRSWIIGDSTLELVAGWRAGCRLAGVRTGVGLADETFEVDVEILSDDVTGVLFEILEMQRAALS